MTTTLHQSPRPLPFGESLHGALDGPLGVQREQSHSGQDQHLTQE